MITFFLSMLKQLSRSDRLLVLTLGGSALMHLLVLFLSISSRRSPVLKPCRIKGWK
jgi:hypothetical protein